MITLTSLNRYLKPRDECYNIYDYKEKTMILVFIYFGV